MLIVTSDTNTMQLAVHVGDHNQFLEVLLYFNKDSSFANYRIISFSSESSKIELKEILIGTPIDTVKKIDPQGNYSFLLHSWTKYPQISYHYFRDGSGYAVQYDDALCVISLSEFYI